MTLKEIHLRAAHWDWVEAKKAWVKAVRDINEAKQTWDRCQAEFYGTSDCDGCTLCDDGTAHQRVSEGSLKD
jgi:hypothetical protein